MRIPNYKFISAVDGSILQGRAGIHRHLKRGVVRISYTSATGDDRIVHRMRYGNSWAKGLVNIFGVLGCTLSHKLAVARAQELIEDGASAALILEDDAMLNEQHGGLNDVYKYIQNILKVASSVNASWQVIQLGTVAAGPAMSRRKKIRTLKHSSLHLSHRDYLAHGYLVSASGCAALLERYEAGYTSDGAIASLQGFAARNKQMRCLHMKPALLLQREIDSDTCTQGTWAKALREFSRPKFRKTMKTKVTMKALKGIRKKLGKIGGLTRAGNGSTVKTILKKKRLVLASYKKNGIFPTRKHSRDTWKVSTELWNRLRSEQGLST